MIRIIRDLLTNADGITHNIIRHGAFWGFLALTGLQAWAILKGQPFSAQDFGVALGALLGGAGAGIGVSAKAEP